MKFVIVILGIMGLLFFVAYQQTLVRSAAMCVLSVDNANGETSDERYLLRFGEDITPGQLRKATRTEYSETYPEGLTCDASYDYTTYTEDSSFRTVLNGGFYTVINNGRRPLNKIVIGFGDTEAVSLTRALKKMTKHDEGWSEARNGFNTLKKGKF
jgi:hypothetical protein